MLVSAGNWSFCVYILHFQALSLWGGAESGFGVGGGYWLVLLAMAALAHRYVQQPCATNVRLKAVTRFGMLTVFVGAAVLSSLPDSARTALLQPAKRAGGDGRNPAAIVYKQGAVDFRLTLRVPAEDAPIAFGDWVGGGQGYTVINPSLAQDPTDSTSVWIAARLHRKDSEKHFLSPRALDFGNGATQGNLLQTQSAHDKNYTVGRLKPARPKPDASVIPGAGAKRRLLERVLGGATDVAVTILKWNSRVSVGVVSLTSLTVGAEGTLHPVFLPFPSPGRVDDLYRASGMGEKFQRSTRQLTSHESGKIWEQEAFRSKGRGWVPCMPPPVRNLANNSATISFSTGPEDPRVQFSEVRDAMQQNTCMNF